MQQSVQLHVHHSPFTTGTFKKHLWYLLHVGLHWGSLMSPILTPAQCAVCAQEVQAACVVPALQTFDIAIAVSFE